VVEVVNITELPATEEMELMGPAVEVGLVYHPPVVVAAEQAHKVVMALLVRVALRTQEEVAGALMVTQQA
jgi:hypothetical protein